MGQAGSTETNKSEEIVVSKKVKVSKTVLALSIVSILLCLGVIGLTIWFTIELTNERNRNSKNCNKPAGEFAVEPRASVSFGVLNECTYNGLKNQPCKYQASNINEAIDQCNRLSDVCNKFVFNSATGYIEIIGLNTGFENFVTNQNSSIYTRQVGITYSSSGSANNANSGGFVSENVSFNSAASTITTLGQTTQATNTVSGGSLQSYF